MNSRTNEDAVWQAELEQELKDNILAFWMTHAVDDRQGGFIGEMSRDLAIREDAGKSLVLTARIVWTFSTAYRVYRDERYRRTAERAYDYLIAHYEDRRHGGYYWMVDAASKASNTKKQMYGQAFAIYALSEYHRAIGSEEALAKAIALFDLLQQHSRDRVLLGYLEALSEDWQPVEFVDMSEGRQRNALKTMNNHLHVLEAFTNLYRVWKEPRMAAALREMIEVMSDRIVDPENAHFKLYFDRDWTSMSDEISFGHDIEGSWLLMEAAEVLSDEEMIHRTRALATRMAEATLDEGLDEDGGLLYEAEPHGLTNTTKSWWVQAEAVVGFYNAYQMSGDEKYAEAARRSWRFITDYIVDRENGEWHIGVDRSRSPLAGPKVSAWKCPYHNARACFEMLERLSLASN
jgi:cellobiose epimerase